MEPSVRRSCGDTLVGEAERRVHTSSSAPVELSISILTHTLLARRAAVSLAARTGVGIHHIANCILQAQNLYAHP